MAESGGWWSSGVTPREPSLCCSCCAKGSLDCAVADERPKSELPKRLSRIRLKSQGGQAGATRPLQHAMAEEMLSDLRTDRGYKRGIRIWFGFFLSFFQGAGEDYESLK